MKPPRKLYGKEVFPVLVYLEAEELTELRRIADIEERSPSGQARWIVRQWLRLPASTHTGDKG